LGTTFGDAGDAAGLVASVDFIEAELLVTLTSKSTPKSSLSAAPKVTASRKEPAPKPASAAAATTPLALHFGKSFLGAGLMS
jgi:hypothetical protein